MDTQLFAAALSRPSRLAGDPLSPAGDGQGSPDRQWPRLPGAAGRPWRSQGRTQPQQRLQACVARHSAITHQRSNGAGNKAARSEAGAANAPAASRNGGKAGNGKPVGPQLQKGSGNGKPVAQGGGQGAAQGKPAGKPAHKGKAPTRADSVKSGAKPATQSGKPAAKGSDRRDDIF